MKVFEEKVGRSMARIACALQKLKAEGISTRNSEVRFTLPPSSPHVRYPGYCIAVDARYLYKQVTTPFPTIRESHEHAERLAWFRVREWLDSSVTLVNSQVISAHELFFPYLLTTEDGEPQTTMYAAFVRSVRRKRALAAAGGGAR